MRMRQCMLGYRGWMALAAGEGFKLRVRAAPQDYTFMRACGLRICVGHEFEKVEAVGGARACDNCRKADEGWRFHYPDFFLRQCQK